MISIMFHQFLPGGKVAIQIPHPCPNRSCFVDVPFAASINCWNT